MRITDSMMMGNMVGNIQLDQQQLAKLEQQASSGVSLGVPSDDPVSAQQVLKLKGLLQNAGQYAKNITTGTAWLSQAGSAMSEMSNVLTRVKELSTQMANGTYNANDRANAAIEVKQLKSQLVQLGNSQVGGQYIFGGFASNTPPFDTTSINNPADPLNGTPVGTYNGTNDAIQMEVGQGTYVPINYSGAQLLRGGTPPGSSGVDIVGMMNNLITALSANDQTGVQNVVADVDGAQNQVLSAQADIGVRTNRVSAASSSIDSLNVSLNQSVSDKQDANMAQVLSQLTSQQTAYQAALATAGKASQLSILDYLK
jgi:flagellar hook-associated protein 3 FlgL